MRSNSNNIEKTASPGRRTSPLRVATSSVVRDCLLDKEVKNRVVKKLRKKIQARIYDLEIGYAIKNKTLFRVGPSEAIGCSFIEFARYLEANFYNSVNGKIMTWTNTKEWHVDHIVPCKAFDLSKKEQVKKCFHYSNFQPLWAKHNNHKRAHVLTVSEINKLKRMPA